MSHRSESSQRVARRTRKGTTATELAIVLPFLLTLAFACCDFGRIICVHQVVANAARTGAESGATHQYTDFTRDAWENDIYQAVFDEMSNLPGFDESDMSYALATTVDPDDVTQIAIDITYPFQTIVTWPLLPTEVDVHEHVEFRQFR